MGYINFVRCQLATSITSTSTSITLSSNTSPFNLPPTDGGTLVLADSINKPSKLEIITYTSRSGLVLNGIVRGAEGTTAQAWPSSSYCYMSFTALMLTSFKADMDAALQTVVNKQDKHTNLTALSGITSGTGLFKRATDGSWVLDTTQYSTVTLASAIPLAGTTSGSVGTSLKAAKEDHTHPVQTSVSGNAGTATKLASPISFTFTGGATGSLSSFDGSSNVTINLTVDANSHTHGLATASINGLMSSAQFTKLAGIADNANNYIHPIGAGFSHIPATTNSNYFLKSGNNNTYLWSLLSKTDVGLSNVDDTSDASKPISTATANALLNKVNTSSVGVANGLATLDASGLVPQSQLPKASNLIYGVVKFGTNATNTDTANGLTSTANRTYQIQKNLTDALVVNVPWTDTVYTHPASGIVAGTYKSVTVDANGHITSGSNPTTLSGFGITDAQPKSTDLTAIASISGTSGFLKKSAANTWLLDTSTYLTSNQIITVSGDATASGSTSLVLTLSDTGVTSGTYTKVTVDAKGRINAGSNPTTLSGYGITDAQPMDADLTAIAGLAGTSGLLKKTAAGTWVLDTTSYIPFITLTDSGTGSLLKLTRDAYGRVSGTAAVTAADITGLSGLFGSTAGTALAITGSTGSSNTLARADHVHPLPTPAAIGAQAALGFTPVQQGGGTGQGNNKVYIGWDSSGVKLQIDTTDMGYIFTSLNGRKILWNDIQSKPTTLSGYSITDATPSSHVGSTGTSHGVASSSVSGFMSSTDKSKLDALNLSATPDLVGTNDSGIKPIYTASANYYRAGSNITLSISDGTTLTASRNHHGSTSKVESYLQNTTTFTQDLFGVSGFSYLYGGASNTSNDGNVYGGYYVATAACTSTSNKYVGGVFGTYASATIDVTNSMVSKAYGVYADISITGTTNPTGSITNAYGLYISLSVVNTYTTNTYSIYCNEYNALGYLAGGLNIGTLNPNNIDGGITVKNDYLYLSPKGKTGTYYGLDVAGIIAGNNSGYVQHDEYGIKFGNDYSSTRESSDSKTLDWYEESSTPLVSSGLTTNTSATAKLTRNGNLVAIDVPSITGAGTATTFKLTGIPVQFRPLVTKEFLVRGTVGGVVSICRAIINTSGEIQVYAGLNSETFSTTSSTRGINKISLSYQLH